MAYNPPIGIPNPSSAFGWEIDRATPDWPASWTQSPSTSATPGYYYVDNTHGSATDGGGNTYGHPDLPRLTIPEGVLPAGTFIYVHAGIYVGGGDRFDWEGNGTSESPIWVSGNPSTYPILQEKIHFGLAANSSFIIFENFETINGAFIDLRATADDISVDHILLRNLRMTGTQSAADSTAISIGWADNTTYLTLTGCDHNNIVVYNCDISNFGDKSATDEGGVNLSHPSSYVWVLDNIIHDVGADSIGGGHYNNYTTRVSQHYYIGRNTFYGNGENGIDIKVVQYVILSQNEIYGPFTREQGGGIVLHYGADTNFHTRDAWVIFNRIHGVSGGISTGSSSGCDNLNIIGNLFYDVHASYAAQADPLNGYCILIDGSLGSHRIVDNTMYDYDSGIRIGGLSATDTCKIHGNILASRSESSNYDLFLENGQESFVTSDYNCYSPGAKFFWSNAERDFTYMQGTASQELNSLSADPGLVDPTNSLFTLESGSLLIDASVEGPVGSSAYTAYTSLFNEDIRKDYYGFARAGDWDIGAIQYLIPRVYFLLNPITPGGASPGTSNLLAWFDLNTNANDSSSNGYNCTTENSPTFTDGYIHMETTKRCYNLTDLRSTFDSSAQDWSYAMRWRSHTSIPANGFPVAGSRFFINVNTTDINAVIGQVGGIVLSNPSVDTWYTIVVVWDNTEGKTKISINGGQFVEFTGTRENVAGSTIYVGDQQNFDCDWVCFYSKALSQDNATWLYNSNSSRVFSDL